jgi:hypothetical protein
LRILLLDLWTTYVWASTTSNVWQGSEPKKEFSAYGSTYGGVNFVHTEAGIQICEWCDRRSDPGRRECRLGTNVRCIVGIENLHLRGMSKHEGSNKTMTNRKLILMGMAPEDI